MRASGAASCVSYAWQLAEASSAMPAPSPSIHLKEAQEQRIIPLPSFLPTHPPILPSQPTTCSKEEQEQRASATAQRRAELERKAGEKQEEEARRLREQARDERRQMRCAAGGWLAGGLTGCVPVGSRRCCWLLLRCFAAAAAAGDQGQGRSILRSFCATSCTLPCQLTKLDPI